MRLYLIPVICFCFAVDVLLLFASNSLAQGNGSPGRMLFAAQLGALYAAVCLRYELGFAESVWGRGLCQLVSGLVSWGLCLPGLVATAVYLLLSMAVGFLAGAMVGTETDMLRAALAACVLWAVYMLRRKPFGKTLPVELRYGNARIQLRALYDTGNTLRDPITGESVLILGPDAAKSLLDLELHQLRDPVATVAESGIAGLRLLPYRTISGQGLLLAIRIKDAQIGKRRRSALVAFAPTQFAAGKGYQALTGGAV